MVVNPHGGPWARDSWGFNPEVQFLANRGYAVLQMNFRGSTGYGKEFWEASFKQWGRTMQDDITDGVQWLIDEGIADPERVGIYGGSYGGYATLAGVTFTPDLYACGVDYVGVSNIFTWHARRSRPTGSPTGRCSTRWSATPRRTRSCSRRPPRSSTSTRSRCPLLVAQGANDSARQAGRVRPDRRGPARARASTWSTSSRTTRATGSATRRTASTSTGAMEAVPGQAPGRPRGDPRRGILSRRALRRRVPETPLPRGGFSFGPRPALIENSALFPRVCARPG